MTREYPSIEICVKEKAKAVDAALAEYFKNDDAELSSVFEAMAYSTLDGGKRIRAFLVLEFARLFGGNEREATGYACALEMIHAFSLVHDDLPCMDDDDLRRGKPSCHKKYGEAQALIAGDALIMLAFECASCASESAERALRAVRTLGVAAGARGMCGGQAMDMYAEGTKVSYEYLCKLQSLKTGALIEAAAELGCIAAGADEEKTANAKKYASCIGRAFQIVDDVLDVEGDEQSLGKKIGSDADSDKTTFVTELGIEGAKKEALRLTELSKSCIAEYEGSEILCALSDWLCTRKY